MTKPNPGPSITFEEGHETADYWLSGLQLLAWQQQTLETGTEK